MRVGDDLLPDPRVQRAGQHRVQQHPRVALGQPADGQLRQARHVLARDPRREHQAHRVGGQPPGGEAQRLRRGPVEPLLIIDHADQRAVAGRLGEQAQHGQADQEPVRRRADAEAERGPQRLLLRHRQMLGAIQQRRAQLVQPGEGQLHLRLHAGRAGHPAPRRAPGQVLQQDGLAHARLPAHYQGPALTTPHAVHEPVQDPALGVPVGQLGGAARPGVSAHTASP